MKKPVKIFISGCLIALALVIVAIVLMPVLINPNSYKPEMTAFIKNKTGRDVIIEGDITLSFIPWLGVNMGKMTIENKPGFQGKAFATVENSQIKLKALPLLSDKVEVTSIALDGLKLNLSQNKLGQKNWDDLTPSPPQPLSSPENRQSDKSAVNNTIQPLAALTIGAISLNEAHVVWENTLTGKSLAISNIELTSDKIMLGRPLDINLTADMSGNLFSFMDTIKAVTAIQIDETLNTIKLNNTRLEWLGKDLAVKQPLTAIINAGAAEINLRQQTFKSSDLQLQSGDIKLSAGLMGEHILTKPSLQGQINAAPFNLSLAMKQWGIEHPATGDAKALSNFALTSKFHLTPEVIELADLDLILDDGHVKGKFAINNFAEPIINFDLAVDTIDLDRYLPPREKEELTSPGFALAASAIHLPLDWMKKLDATGKLAFSTLKVKRMTLQDTKLIVTAKNGDIKISQTADRFYQGLYAGNLAIVANAEKSHSLLKENLTNIHLEPYLQDTKGKAKVGGILTAATTLQSNGNKTKELRNNLSGNVSFFLKDGFIHGFNLEKMLAQAKNAVINGKQLETKEATDRTAFNASKGTITIGKGQLSNSDLSINTTTFQSKGQGTAALENGQLDYTITTKLVKEKAIPNKPAQLHDTPIVIHVGGTFNKPSFALDVGALLTDKNKAKLKSLIDHNKDKIEKLIDKLDKKNGFDVKDLLKKIF